MNVQIHQKIKGRIFHRVYLIFHMTVLSIYEKEQFISTPRKSTTTSVVKYWSLYTTHMNIPQTIRFISVEEQCRSTTQIKTKQKKTPTKHSASNLQFYLSKRHAKREAKVSTAALIWYNTN